MFTKQTGVESLAIKAPQQAVGRRIPSTAGSLRLLDGTSFSVDVRATVRHAPEKTTYKVKGNGSMRVRGTIRLTGCPPDIDRVRLSVVARGKPRRSVKLLTDIGIAGTMAGNAEILDENDVAPLLPDQSDATHLTFLSGAPILASLVPGKVLVAGIAATTPNGLLRRVVNVVPQGPVTVVETEASTLKEAFAQLDIEVGNGLSQNARGVLVPRFNVDVDDNITLPGGLHEPVSFPFTVNGVTLTVEGQLDFDPSISIGVHIHSPEWDPIGILLDSFHLELNGELTATVGASVGAGFGHEESQPVVHVPFAAIPIGPIVIVPSFEVVAGFDASIAAAMSASVTGGVSVSIGVMCFEDNSCQPEKLVHPIFHGSADVSAGADVTAFVRPELRLALYDAAGAHVGLQAFAKLDTDLTATPWWVLSAGVDMDVGADLTIGVIELLSYDHTEHVAQVQVAQSSSPPPTTTSTTLPPCNAWNATYDAGNDSAGPVAADQHGDVIVAGSLTGYPAIVKLNGDDGSEVWRWNPHSGDTNGYDGIALMSNGNVIVKAPGSSASGTVLVMHESATGTPVWTGGFGFSCSGASYRLDNITAIAAAANGDAFATGSSLTCPGGLQGPYSYAVSRVDGGTGAQLWMTFLPQAPSLGTGNAVAVAIAPDGNVVTAGSVSIGDRDAYYAAKLDASTGAVIWETTGAFGSQPGSGTGISSLSLDSVGNVIAGGRVVNVLRPAIPTPVDGTLMVVEKYDGATGGTLWNWSFVYDGDCCEDGLQSPKGEQAHKTAIDSNDDVFVGGSVGINALTCDRGGQALAIAKLNGMTGELLWSIPSQPRIPHTCPVFNGNAEVTGLATDAAGGDVFASVAVGNGQYVVERFDGSDGSDGWQVGGSGRLGDVVLSNWGVVVAGTTVPPGPYNPNFTVLKIRASDGSASGACQ